MSGIDPNGGGALVVPGGGGATLSDATPAALGTAAAGVSTSASRADHVHAAPAAATVDALLPRALPGTALHLHRLNEATGALADQGSVGTAAVISGSSAVRATPGPYRWGGGIELVSPAATDRITVATSILAGDCSLALTIRATTDAAPAVSGSSVTLMALWDGADNAVMLLCHPVGGLYAYLYGAATGSFSADYTPSSWAVGHRCVVTYEHGAAGATKQVKFYVDGTLRETFTATAAIAATLTEATMLGLAGDPFAQGAVGGVTIGDAQVWGSLLTAAQVTADWRQVRGALL